MYRKDLKELHTKLLKLGLDKPISVTSYQRTNQLTFTYADLLASYASDAIMMKDEAKTFNGWRSDSTALIGYGMKLVANPNSELGIAIDFRFIEEMSSPWNGLKYFFKASTKEGRKSIMLESLHLAKKVWQNEENVHIKAIYRAAIDDAKNYLSDGRLEADKKNPEVLKIGYFKKYDAFEKLISFIYRRYSNGISKEEILWHLNKIKSIMNFTSEEEREVKLIKNAKMRIVTIPSSRQMIKFYFENGEWTSKNVKCITEKDLAGKDVVYFMEGECYYFYPKGYERAFMYEIPESVKNRLQEKQKKP